MVDFLIQALDNPEGRVLLEAQTKLTKLSTEAVDALLTALASSNIRLSWQAALVLGNIPDPHWLDPMCHALVSKNILLGQVAVEALEKALQQDVVNIFVDALPPSRLVVQLALIKALERLGDARSVGSLCRLLEITQSAVVRYTIVETLGVIGNMSIIPLIESFQKDANHHVRERVEVALKSLRKEDGSLDLFRCPISRRCRQ